MMKVGSDASVVVVRSGGLTIGQLATYAGVTIKAVRHYHKRGLLAEPPRDASGYRRYGAEHAIQLLKVRTLADAGVPLARIKDLLAADPERFATAISEIDHNLQARIDQLCQVRERVARLHAGERLFVSAEIAGFLDQLQKLGVSRRALRMERDVWILMQAVSPARVAVWVAEKRKALNDPEFCAIYLECDAAFDWSPDDPRLYALAERTRRWTATQRSRSSGAARSRTTEEQAISRLVARSGGVSSPAWDHLLAIIRQRAAHAVSTQFERGDPGRPDGRRGP
jgi:DNA-binding transcriptional MerR regulator